MSSSILLSSSSNSSKWQLPSSAAFKINSSSSSLELATQLQEDVHNSGFTTSLQTHQQHENNTTTTTTSLITSAAAAATSTIIPSFPMVEQNVEASDTVPPYMQHMTIILVILHMSVFITGLVGNSLVCLSVYRNKSLQTVTNYYIVNLAVADFLVILICLPPTVYWDLTLTWNFGLVLCKLVLYLQSISVSVSVLTLTCISIDRWYAICRPLEFSSTKYRAKITIALIWLVSMLFASPDLIFLTTRSLYQEKDFVYMDCTYSWPESNTKMYQLCIVSLLFIGPFILMSISYSHIVNVLWRNETMAETMEHSVQLEEEQQYKLRKKLEPISQTTYTGQTKISYLNKDKSNIKQSCRDDEHDHQGNTNNNSNGGISGRVMNNNRRASKLKDIESCNNEDDITTDIKISNETIKDEGGQGYNLCLVDVDVDGKKNKKKDGAKKANVGSFTSFDTGGTVTHETLKPYGDNVATTAIVKAQASGSPEQVPAGLKKDEIKRRKKCLLYTEDSNNRSLVSPINSNRTKKSHSPQQHQHHHQQCRRHSYYQNCHHQYHHENVERNRKPSVEPVAAAGTIAQQYPFTVKSKQQASCSSFSRYKRRHTLDQQHFVCFEKDTSNNGSLSLNPDGLFQNRAAMTPSHHQIIAKKIVILADSNDVPKRATQKQTFCPLSDYHIISVENSDQPVSSPHGHEEKKKSITTNSLETQANDTCRSLDMSSDDTVSVKTAVFFDSQGKALSSSQMIENERDDITTTQDQVPQHDQIKKHNSNENSTGSEKLISCSRMILSSSKAEAPPTTTKTISYREKFLEKTHPNSTLNPETNTTMGPLIAIDNNHVESASKFEIKSQPNGSEVFLSYRGSTPNGSSNDIFTLKMNHVGKAGNELATMMITAAITTTIPSTTTTTTITKTKTLASLTRVGGQSSDGRSSLLPDRLSINNNNRVSLIEDEKDANSMSSQIPTATTTTTTTTTSAVKHKILNPQKGCCVCISNPLKRKNDKWLADKTSKKYRQNLANYAATRDKYREQSSGSGFETKRSRSTRQTLLSTNCYQQPTTKQLLFKTSNHKSQAGNSSNMVHWRPENGSVEISEASTGLVTNSKCSKRYAVNNTSAAASEGATTASQSDETPPVSAAAEGRTSHFSSHASCHKRFCKLIESRKKAAKMLIVIVIMFGLCYLPVHFLNILRYTIGLPQNDITTIASLVSHWLCYFNSAVNPLIYNLMSGKFRHEFANLFFCKCFRRGSA